MATTTNHIAEAAGVSVGLVYKYFPEGKAEIAYQISLHDHSSIMETISLAGARKGELRERLHKMLLVWISQHRRNEPFLRAMNIVMLENPRLFRGYSEVVKRMAQKAHSVFWSNQTEDEIESRLQEGMLALFHMIESVVHRHVLSAEVFETDEELVDFLSVIAFAVIKEYSRAKDS